MKGLVKKTDFWNSISTFFLRLKRGSALTLSPWKTFQRRVSGLSIADHGKGGDGMKTFQMGK